MHIPALVLALVFGCVNSRMLLGSSDSRRTFYHSIRNVILVEDVDLRTGFKYGECSHLFEGRNVKVSFYAGRFYPHYEISSGPSGYLSDEDAYEACISDYKRLRLDVLYDIGLTALALADFAKELGMTHNLNAIPALEFVINTAKRNIDRTDERRLADTNRKFVGENLKDGSDYSEDVHFRRPLESVYREPKDFLSRPVDDIYDAPSEARYEAGIKFDYTNLREPQRVGIDVRVDRRQPGFASNSDGHYFKNEDTDNHHLED